MTRRQLNIIFWTLFLLTGTVLIAGLLTGTIIIDVLLSLLLIAVGFHGLLEEISAREPRRNFKKIDDSLFQISEWLEKTYMFAKSTKEKHDLRLHHLDTKRSQSEEKAEKRLREFSKRIIELENKHNSLRKSIAPEESKPLTGFERRIGRTANILRKDGLITPAIYSRSMSVARKAAIRDLTKMSRMNIVRKMGKGKTSYYVLFA
jgi:hypothetical protein